MPELLDLSSIEKHLCHHVLGGHIMHVSEKQPIDVRVLLEAPFEKTSSGKGFKEVRTHGPFLYFMLTDRLDPIMNFVLTGRLQHSQAQDKPGSHLCFTLSLDDGCHLNYLDIDKLGKVYLTEAGHNAQIPASCSRGSTSGRRHSPSKNLEMS